MDIEYENNYNDKLNFVIEVLEDNTNLYINEIIKLLLEINNNNDINDLKA